MKHSTQARPRRKLHLVRLTVPQLLAARKWTYYRLHKEMAVVDSKTGKPVHLASLETCRLWSQRGAFRALKPEQLTQLLRVFGVEPNDLFTETPHAPTTVRPKRPSRRV